jgi:DNA modification methylase
MKGLPFMGKHTKYRLIEIKIPNGLNDREAELVNSINRQYEREDFFIEFDSSKIMVHINQLNLDKFMNSISDFYYDENSIFHKIYDRIVSMGSYGIKEGKRIFVNYDKERKVIGRKVKEGKRSKFFYAKDSGFSKTQNAFPKQYLNKIICDDSENVLKLLPDNCVDLTFTSPPYNFGLGYENNDDSDHWQKYFEKLFSIFKECIRVTKYGGRIIVNVQPLFSDYIPSHHIISNFFLKNKMLWKGEILWEKNNYNCKYTAWGSWRSPSSPYLKYTWEFLEIFCKGDLIKKGDKDKIDITADEFKQWVFAKWNIAPERKMKEYGHPAMFPEQLVERVLKLFSYQGDVILDPFNGVGTTTAVARRFSRNYIGIDISKEYCNKAIERMGN